MLGAAVCRKTVTLKHLYVDPLHSCLSARWSVCDRRMRREPRVFAEQLGMRCVALVCGHASAAAAAAVKHRAVRGTDVSRPHAM